VVATSNASSLAQRDRVAHITLLVAAFAFFLLLRVWGLNFGSPPIMVHPDEYAYAGAATSMRWSSLEPHEFENPPLFTHLLFLAREAAALWMGPEQALRWAEQGGLHRLARWIVALLGALTPLVVAAAAWRLLGSRAAAIAAALVVGCSFLHGRDSHYGVNDVPMVFLIALSLATAARGFQSGGVRPLVLSAICAGLAAATKYSGAVAVLLPIAALLLRPAPQLELRGRALGSLALAALALATFVAANPFCVLNFEHFRQGFENQLSSFGDNRFWGQSREPGWQLYARASSAMLGLLNLGAAVAGLLLVLRRAPRVCALLASVPLGYLAVMLAKELFFWRFALPLLPFAAIFAAEAWTRAARALPVLPGLRGVRPSAALAALLAVAVAQPLAQLLRHDLLCTREPTWLLARNWLLRNAEAGTLVFAEGVPPKLPPKLKLRLPRLHIDKLSQPREIAQDPGLSAEIEQGGLVLTDSFLEQGWRLEGGDEARGRLDVYARLRERFELLAEFAPGPHGDPQPFTLDMLYTPLLDLNSIDRPGHTIRIYQVPPSSWSAAIPAADPQLSAPRPTARRRDRRRCHAANEAVSKAEDRRGRVPHPARPSGMADPAAPRARDA